MSYEMQWRFIVYSSILVCCCLQLSYCISIQSRRDRDVGFNNGTQIMSRKPVKSPDGITTATNTSINVPGATTEAAAVTCQNITTENGTVCVCNKNRCDNIPAIPNLNPGQFVWYVSSKDGSRFDQAVGQFALNSSAHVGNVIYVSRNNTRQKIIGFGGTFTDSAAMIIKSLSDDLAEQLLCSYFGWNGIGYTLGRVAIGATDYSPCYYSYLNTAGSTICDFRLSELDYKYKIPLLRRVKALTDDTLRLLATAWSAPDWMKTSCNHYLRRNSLREQYYELWAQYCTRFLIDYRRQGVDFWALTPGNEPMNQYYSPWPEAIDFFMTWPPNYQSQWLVDNLMPNLIRSRFSDIKIFAFDGIRKYATFYADWFFRDNSTGFDDCLECVRSRTYNYTTGLAFHAYNETDADTLNQLHASYPTLPILMTEYCPQRLDPWDAAEDYIIKLIDTLNGWSIGWIDLNLALDTNLGPHYATPGICSAPILVNASAGEFYKLPVFYGIGHFSKFIIGGSTIVKVYPPAKDNIYVTAALRPDGKTVIVAYNRNEYPKTITVVVDDGTAIPMSLKAKAIYTMLF